LESFDEAGGRALPIRSAHDPALLESTGHKENLYAACASVLCVGPCLQDIRRSAVDVRRIFGDLVGDDFGEVRVIRDDDSADGDLWVS